MNQNEAKALLFSSLFFSFLFAFLNGSSFLFAEAKLLSLSIGKVQNQSFTSRDVHINYIMERHIYSRDSKTLKRLSIQSSLFLSEIDRFLLEEAIYLEMQNFSEPSLSPEEEKKRWEKMLSFSNSYWLEQEVSEGELQVLLRKKSLVKKFLQARIEASRIPVTKREAYEHFLQNKKKFGSTSFKRVEKKISKQLSQKQLKERLSAWFQVLHQKYKIKNLMVQVQRNS